MTSPNTLTQADLVAALPRLRRYARVLTGDAHRADDLVAKTLASAWGGQHSWQQETGVRTWLFTIMHYLHRDWSAHLPLKLAQTTPDSEGGLTRGREIPARAVQSGHADAEDTLSRISRLQVDEREVLVLVAVEEMPYGEIATLLGVSIGTVLATLTRARAKIRQMAVE